MGQPGGQGRSLKGRMCSTAPTFGAVGDAASAAWVEKEFTEVAASPSSFARAAEACGHIDCLSVTGQELTDTGLAEFEFEL